MTGQAHPGAGRPRRRRAPALAAGLAALATTLAGCGGSGHAAAPPVATTTPLRALTITQAVQLASTLYLNYAHLGARVNIQVPYSATTTAVITGTVDFHDHAGHLVVLTETAGEASSSQAVDYTASAVYEDQGAGADGTEQWLVHPPDPTDRPIDRIIQLLVALASPQRDNPLLVQESQARFEGTTSLGGVEVAVYRYNPAITYLVGVRDGLLHRFIGTVQGISGPVTVDLSDRAAYPSPPPPASEVQPAPAPGPAGA